MVDATGQSAFIASRLGLKDTDSRLKKGTIWTYWKGAKRDEGKDEGATLILQTQGKKSWFWYIPLPDDIVSVGIVAGVACLDLDYVEDVSAEVDMNYAALEDGGIVEVQGTAEGNPFSRDALDRLLALAQGGVESLFGRQREALEV